MAWHISFKLEMAYYLIGGTEEIHEPFHPNYPVLRRGIERFYFRNISLKCYRLN
jgi:hypothetical protein